MQELASFVPDGVVVALLLIYVLRDVSLTRLERFARRQLLPITVNNGPIVIDYLARTRRWRAGGAIAGLCIAYACKFTQNVAPNFGGGGVLLGWILGAVAAEWRISARPRPGTRRTALLVSRRLNDYLPRWLVIVNVLAWMTTMALAIGDIVWTRTGKLQVVAEAAAVMLVVPASGLVVRHVLTRPQPVAPPDVLAADDAIRSRSLHVLAGSALAVSGALIAVLDTASDTFYGSWLPSALDVALQLGGVLLPLLGLFAATSPFRANRHRAWAVGVGV